MPSEAILFFMQIISCCTSVLEDLIKELLETNEIIVDTYLLKQSFLGTMVPARYIKISSFVLDTQIKLYNDYKEKLHNSD